MLFLLVLAFCFATNSATADGLPISPRVLEDMVGTMDTDAERSSKSPAEHRTIPIPAAIAFDADGCFAGIYATSDLKKLKFDCIGGLDRLALAKVHPEASKQAKGSPVVLELIPSFAIGKCTDCETISADLRELLKSRSIDAKIFSVDIDY